MKTYVVHIKSVPGFFEQYSGSLTVAALNEEEAIEAALTKLKKGAFPDRSKDMWKVTKVERLFK